MAGIFIKRGEIVTAEHSFTGDILVENGEIKAAAPHLESPGSSVRQIDADGFLVFPGGIDPHVHMELPVGGTTSADDFESGTLAAITGGTTTIIDFVTPDRDQPLVEAFLERKKAAEKSLCDYGLHMSITGWRDSIPEEMKRCAHEYGMPSFKAYLAYKESIGLEDRPLISLMDTAARLGLLVMVHCEHGDVVSYLQKKLLAEGRREPRYHPRSRPPEVEGEAVKRALLMAQATGSPLYIVHVSTRDGLREIEGALSAGQGVFAETCPHYLLLGQGEYQKPGFAGAAYVMSPPLRPAEHQEALWEGLKDGTLRVTATDHCPFHLEGQKEMGRDDFTRIPNGAAGVEDRLALLYTYGVLEGKISLPQFVGMTSTAAAQIFGMYPRKGTVAVGSDADLVIWDPRARGVISAATHRQNCDTNIYEGFEVRGKPHMVIANGKVAYEAGKIKAEKGAGRYIFRTGGANA